MLKLPRLIGDSLQRWFASMQFMSVILSAIKKRIADYLNLQGYLKELYQVSGVRETTDFDHIKRHYYYSHTGVNPTQIIPKGPDLDLDSAHFRDRI